jgi:PTS system nitrogen regulatory IIA component
MNTEFKQVARWLQPEGIHLDVPLHDATHALEFIAAAIAERHDLDAAPLFRALCRREQAGSTALGAGFAIPHARIPGIDRPLTLLLRAKRPVDFKAADHEPVWLMLAILVPEHGDKQDHLRLLALVAELFSEPRFRARMDTGRDAARLADDFRDGIARLQGR